ASSSRPLLCVNGLRSGASTSRNCRGTASPRLFGLPRRKTTGSTSADRSARTIALGGAAGGGALHSSTPLSRALSLSPAAPVPRLQVGLVGLAELGDRRLALLQLGLEGAPLRAVLAGADERQLLRLLGAGKDAVERVVVALRDGVELVVVAAGAGHRQAEQAA